MRVATSTTPAITTRNIAISSTRDADHQFVTRAAATATSAT
jgi:hypothetical protein